jgi:hypothetical protein
MRSILENGTPGLWRRGSHERTIREQRPSEERGVLVSFDSMSDVNWLAVIVGGAVYFALGGFWYSPAGFGKQWMRAVGMNMPEEGERPGAAIYVAPLLADLVAAIATAWLVEATGSDTFGEGLLLGLAVSIGFMVTLIATTATFSQLPEPMTWFWITATYNVIGITLVAVLASVWD